MRADDLHVNARKRDRHAQLVKRIRHDERREARQPGAFARRRQPRRDADEIRFRDADVEEAIRELLAEDFRARRVADVAVHDDDVRIGIAELRQRQPERFASRFAEFHECLVLVC